MKFNFKKIASVLAATIMLGSTVSFAAAAWPAPFVANGSSASAIVYGATAPVTGGDKVAAINLGAELDKGITATISSGSSGSTGDIATIEKTNDKFNLGDNMTMFNSNLDSEDLANVLANGVFTNDNRDEFKYEQTIDLGALKLTHFADSKFNSEKPVIGFDLANGDHILNYTLEFTDPAENTNVFGSASGDDLETTDLTMLGMSYYVQKVENTTNGVKMTLLDSANDASISEGDTKTVAVGSISYEVSIGTLSGNADAPKVKLVINGVQTNALAAGEVEKVATDTYVSVKDISMRDVAGTTATVDFSIGSGKIVLENKQEVQINGEAVSDIEKFKQSKLISYIVSSTSTTIDSITLKWDMKKDAWLAPGTDLVLPGFETIKFAMSGFTSPKAEKTTLVNDGDTVFTVSTELTDGKIILPILYTDDDQKKFIGLGEKADSRLITSSDNTGNVDITLDLDTNDYFVMSWVNGDNYESSAFVIDSISNGTDGKVAVGLKNLADGKDLSFTKVTDSEDMGSITLTLSAADEETTNSATLTLSSSGTIYTNKLVTKEGLALRLPVSSVNASDGNINLTDLTIAANSNTWAMNFTEENADNGNILGGLSGQVIIGIDSDGPEAQTLSIGDGLETEDGSRIYENYAVSDLATKTVFDKPSTGTNTLDIFYAGSESTASVYIAEASATVGAVKDSVKVVTDAEVDSVKSKNLIVIGGSCINTVAASMLGSTTPLCGDSWASKTGAGPGKYLIQVAASPVNAEKIAMLIAGYDSVQTTDAVAKVIEGGISTEVGKIIGPTIA